MSVFAYPSETIREAEAPLLEAGVPLMARAARALANISIDTLTADHGQVTGARVCVLAGPGNNAGDALFAAATLGRRGAAVTIITLFDRTHGEGLTAARRAGAQVIAFTSSEADAARADALRELSRAHLVLDGILGTGGRRGLPDHISSLIADWVPHRTGRLIAVDIPSDLDPNHTGAEKRLHADRTVTFGGLKTELIDTRADEFTGTIDVIDIGLGLDPSSAAAELLDRDDLVSGFPRPDEAGHKYSRGVTGVLAGSEDYPGAGVLTTTSAVNTGAGMVRYLGSPLVAEYVLGLHPEVVNASGRIDSVVLGPGDPESEFVQGVAEALAGNRTPVVVDAGGLDMIARAETMAGTWLADRPLIITPHAAELARLLSRLLGEIITAGRIGTNPMRWARRAAELTGAIVLLKGHHTVIAAPDGHVVLPAPGPGTLATAGSGDVLAGILGTLAAITAAHGRYDSDDRTRPPREWARLAGLGVLLHNEAGRCAVTASGFADAIAEVVGELIHGTD
ncbi:bifunctional ADP-dependent NAD(P)H-hydrate dehydratase/NAD(P)H-hydrate epimerase [Brevibacterium sp. JSBI002]|uniref:bifunctional ADP-dependent NAD(P)H-hydrate dehydratase/NAD(P)H-hydrate epimerase n=1 Tax=Brevibacterium sp. JSBI002 TaxID=2886045 RepID=UPI0022328952|nr:bifunctional ADP-dependent NAD(P)H-hydrate dehydratase/NAD(P)H-hydrate epimerase [Brevibacterium sp. JSBI002]UZD61484.1 bifunctional ADP-dependent NAD(P)H-hydrate dehydratase/NAD(P)H-hydrate epimerase [Brevibacterium sp. JSBI002]